MSDYAVVLQKKDDQGKELVVKVSNFGGLSDLQYTKDGKVKSFTYQGTKYYSVYDVSTLVFIDYVDGAKFDQLIINVKKQDGEKYNGVSVSRWKNPNPKIDITFKSFAALAKASYGDLIYGELKDETGLCYNYYVWPYTNPYIGPPENPDKFTPGSSSFDCDVFGSGTTAKGFFDSYKDYVFYDSEKKDPRLVGELASLLKNVDQKLLAAFDGFTVQGVSTGIFSFSTTVNGYSRKDFLEYKNALQKWLEIYEQNVKQLKGLSDPEKVYIICDVLGRYNMLSSLSVDLKIQVLKVLVSESLTNWTKFSFLNYQFQHREDIVIKIIDAVPENQAEDFLSRLTGTIITDSRTVSAGTGGAGKIVESKESLYKLLFYKIDDYGGADNFTTFIKKLNALVLKSNGFTSDDATTYDADELKSITEYQFIWGPFDDKNRVEYSVLNRNNQTVQFEERISTKTKIDQKYNNYYSSSLGVPVATFPEYITEYSTTKKTLNHFDIVSVHYYQNPSFVDTTTDSGYKGRHAITFAGFVDYLIEKENTQGIDDFIQAALFVISLTIGFGELLSAIRSASIARAVVGAIIVSGDTSVYLSTNTAFRNYIKERYPEDYEHILNVMMIAGTIAALGSTNVSTKILDAYTIDEAVEFLGTARQALVDSELIANMTENDLKVLKEGMLRFEKALEKYQGNELIATGIRRAKAALKFYDDADLKLEISNLSLAYRLKFMDEFGDVSTKIVERLHENSDFVVYWNELSDVEKEAFHTNIPTNLNEWYEAKIFRIADEKLKSNIWIDVRTKQKYRPNEMVSIVEIDIKFKADFIPNGLFEAGDAIGTSGIMEGKSVDVMGLPKGAFNPRSRWVFDYDEALKDFKDSIDAHFRKITDPKEKLPALDYLVLDFRNFDEFDTKIRKSIMDYLDAPAYPYRNLRLSKQFIMIN